MIIAYTFMTVHVCGHSGCQHALVSASVIFTRLSSPDLKDRSERIDSILKTICSTGHFNSVVEHLPQHLVKACKHIMKGSVAHALL